MSYTVLCLALILSVAWPLAGAEPTDEGLEQRLVAWLLAGYLAPIFETFVFQDGIQEFLLRRGASTRLRIGASWIAFALVHSSSLQKLLVVGGVQGCLYAVTYAIWRKHGRNSAFAATLLLHLLTNNLLILGQLL